MPLSKIALPAVLALTLIAADPSVGHVRRDPLELAPTAPAAGAVRETVTGTVRELVVADHVAGMTVRHVLVVPQGGGAATALRGAGVDALRHGAQVSVTGRRNGEALFVEQASVAKDAPASVTAATGRVAGRLMFLHSDDFDTGKTRYHYEVHGDDGHVTGLLLHIQPESLQSGMKVAASGQQDPDSGDLEAARIDIEALAEPETDAAASPGVTAKAALTHAVMVTLLKFSDTGADPMPPATAQQVMTTNAGSVANYFAEASFGQHALNVTVTPWVKTATLASPTACGSTQWSQIQQAADAAAKAAGYTATYEYHVYVFPKLASCAWAGLAYIGNPKWAFINGAGAVTTNVIAHEMGHNFGLLHAGSRDCGAAAIGGTCSVAEYGDMFNTMGQGNSMHYAAAQKLLLGWIPAGSVKTHASGSATYTISPLELGGGTTYAVKVPVATQRTYWLEYRQPLGFDAGLSQYPSNGVQIRVAAPFESTCSGCADDTQLLDLTPGTTARTDGTLLVGQTFKDPTYGTTISVLSANPTAVTVQVSSSGSTPPPVSSTTTALRSSANPAAVGTRVTFTATVTGSSPTGSVAFTSNGATLSGCGAVALAGTGNAPTASCSTAVLAAGSSAIVAKYAGNATNAASTSATLTQSMTTAPPPTTGAINVALASAGATASASSTATGYQPSYAINGDRKGSRAAGSLWWNDANQNVYPDWLQVTFNGRKTIDRVVVYSLQDNYGAGIEPTDTAISTAYGLRDFTIQGWNGSAWVTLASVTGNNLIKRTVTFPAYATDRIRVNVTRSISGYSRIVEVEAWGQ